MLTAKELKYWIFSDVFSLFCVFLSILPEGQLPVQNQQQCQNNVRYIKQATTEERYQKNAMEKTSNLIDINNKHTRPITMTPFTGPNSKH